jgi:hypothetical protein
MDPLPTLSQHPSCSNSSDQDYEATMGGPFRMPSPAPEAYLESGPYYRLQERTRETDKVSAEGTPRTQDDNRQQRLNKGI